jgi:hypothetical protein
MSAHGVPPVSSEQGYAHHHHHAASRPYLRTKAGILQVLQAVLVRILKFRRCLRRARLFLEAKEHVAKRALGFVPQDRDLAEALATVTKRGFVEGDGGAAASASSSSSSSSGSGSEVGAEDEEIRYVI